MPHRKEDRAGNKNCSTTQQGTYDELKIRRFFPYKGKWVEKAEARLIFEGAVILPNWPIG